MGRVPRDLFLYAHVAAAVGGAFWLVTSGSVISVGIASLALIAAGAIYVLARERRTGRVIDVEELPAALFVLDLAASTLWMVASAPNPRSVAFVVLMLVGALGVYAVGSRAFALTVAAYVVGRAVQEAVRIGLGIPTPAGQIVSEFAILLLMTITFTGTLRSYARARERGTLAIRRATSVERIARQLSAETDPLAVLRSIPEHALPLVAAEYGALVVRKGDHFEVAAGAGLGTRVVGTRRSADEGVFSDVLRTRETVAVRDYRQHPRAVVAARDTGIRSVIATPIFVRGELAACLILGRTQIRPFDGGDRDALEGLAAHASIALANARTVEIARRSERLSRALMDEPTPDRVYEVMTKEAAEAFNTEFVFVTEILADGARMAAGVGPAAALAGRAYDQPGPLTREVVAKREALYVRDYIDQYAITPDAEPVHVDREGRRGSAGLIARDAGIRAILAAPIVVGDAVAAVLVVGTAEATRAFDELDRQAVMRFADIAAAAVGTLRRRAQRERRIRRLAVLNEAAISLTAAETPQRVARLAWEAAAKLVERDSFYVARFDEARKAFHFILQADGETVEEPSAAERWEGDMVVPLGDGPTSQVVLTGEPFVGPAGPGAVRRFGDLTRQSASAIHVPLRHGDRIVGVLSAQSYRTKAYTHEDVEVLQSLAHLVAGAFENLWQVFRLRELYLASVKALAAAVDARDPYTRSHSARVSALARLIADEMRLDEDEVRRIQLGALLHDIGKIGIPDAILNKPAALSADEWVVMRTHPSIGASIIEAVEPLADLAEVVREHHERHDGTGYPAGIDGSRISLAAAIVAVADAYEVIVSKRSYKEALSVDFALAELRRYRGTQFHPDVVDAFVRVIERDRSEGARLLARIGAIEQEDMAELAGPGDVVQRYVAVSQTHGRRLAVLQRLASEFGAVLDLDELAGRLLRIICDTMGYENGFLTTLDRDTGDQVIRAAFGPSAAYSGAKIPTGVGISSWVLQHARLQNVGDVRSDARFFGPADIRSNLIVPLRIEEEVVGVIGIESPRLDAFGSEDEQLLTAVSHQIAAAVRVAHLHRAAKKAAATDPLTGLANRRAFFDRLDATLASSANDGTAVTVAIADVDSLKQLNDEHGHQAGDEGLIRIGETLVEGVRTSDLVARIGGDEFAVLFVGAPIMIADRIMRRAAEKLAASRLSGGQPAPAISWGLAQATGQATSDQVLDIADRAMYRHKRRSRSKVS